MGNPRAGRSQISSETLITSFHYAWLGLRICWLTQRNFRIHVCLAWGVLGLSCLLPVSTTKVLVIFLVVALVLLAELFNTALEWLLDCLIPEYSPLVGHIKDVAAAGVLVTALAAAVVGLGVFGPLLLDLPVHLRPSLAAYPWFVGVYGLATLLLVVASFLIPVQEL